MLLFQSDGEVAGTVAVQQKASNTAPGQQVGGKGAKTVSLDEALGILMSGFLRGGGAGFLKGTGEIIKGTSAVSREVRVGVTHVSKIHLNGI